MFLRCLITFELILMIHCLAKCQDLNQGLIFEYKFQGNFNDASINAINASGTGSFDQDRFNDINNSLYLNGESEFLVTANLPITKPSLPVSYAFWLKYDEQGRWNHIFNSNYLANGYHGSWVLINPQGKIASGFGDGSGCICSSARQSFSSQRILDTDQWYFIIITIDQFSDFQLFINCKAEPINISGTGGNTISYDSEPGNLGRSNSNDGIKFYKGNIDDFRYWNRKLTPQEIDLLLDEQKPFFDQGQTDILSYTVFDQIGASQIDNINKTIFLEVGCNVDVTKLIADYTAHPGSTFQIGSIQQIDGVTANDFTNPIVYTVIHDVTCASSDWTVIVQKEEITSSEAAELTSFTSIGIQDQVGPTTINTVNRTITFEVICQTDINNLFLLFTTENSTIVIYDGDTQLSGNSFNFTQPLNIELVNNNFCVTSDWTLIVQKEEIMSSEATELTSFVSIEIQDQAGSTTTNTVSRTITFEVICQADINSLYLLFTTDNSTDVIYDGNAQSSGNSFSFLLPLNLELVNNNFCVTSDWTLIVQKEEITSSEAIELTSFTSIELQDQSGPGKVDAANRTITFEVICEANLNELYLFYSINNSTSLIYDGSTQDSGNSFNFLQPLNVELNNQNACVSQNWTIIVEKKHFMEEEVLDMDEFFIPNVITPNEDGINETFILGDVLIGSTLSIINRYGVIVYQSSNYQNNFNGANLSAGVYYYAVDYSCYSELIKGTLSILR